MSRLINDTIKRNLWGVSVPNAFTALDPQRNDLWYFDFSNVVAGISQAFGPALVSDIIQPQLVQSVSLPENKIKVDSFRRNSIPYQMPSWDEPLDIVRMSFVMDSNDFNVSRIYQFLGYWFELGRAGRGFRDTGYQTNINNTPVLLLDANYRSTYRFDCYLSFLRGNNDGASSTSLFSDLEAWQTLRLQQMWIAGLKISDLNYTHSAVTTIEANFYVESIDWLPEP